MKVVWRVEKLEAAAKAARCGVVIVWKHADESDDAAIARWMKENDEKADPRTGAAAVHLISWLPVRAAEGAAA